MEGFVTIVAGYCETCAKMETCAKDIGFIWGFCETDYEPKEKEDKEHEHIQSL